VEYDDGGVGFEGLISDAEIVYPDCRSTLILESPPSLQSASQMLYP